MDPEISAFLNFAFYNPWFAFLWGACWGSFMNVVIYRYPEGRSVVHPASACPSCQTPIKMYDNVPVLSWLILRGKCRQCKAPFSAMYCVREALFGLVCLGAIQAHPYEPVLGLLLSSALVTGIPLVWLLVSYRKAPWYLWLLTVGFGLPYGVLLF